MRSWKATTVDNSSMPMLQDLRILTSIRHDRLTAANFTVFFRCNCEHQHYPILALTQVSSIKCHCWCKKAKEVSKLILLFGSTSASVYTGFYVHTSLQCVICLK